MVINTHDVDFAVTSDPSIVTRRISFLEYKIVEGGYSGHDFDASIVDCHQLGRVIPVSFTPTSHSGHPENDKGKWSETAVKISSVFLQNFQL